MRSLQLYEYSLTIAEEVCTSDVGNKRIQISRLSIATPCLAVQNIIHQGSVLPKPISPLRPRVYRTFQYAGSKRHRR